jgi:methylmalonyl-CoA/ethylmalonyl-CoA epimerase
MKIEGVEHIGIAVADLDRCIERFEKLLGLECKQRERSEPNKVEVAVFECGGTRLELVSPIDQTSPIHRFVEKGGNSLHHICFKVEGIDQWLTFLDGEGVGLIDKTPRDGALGHRIAFLKPKSICNFLIELSEEKP